MFNALLAAAIATAPPSVHASAQPLAEDASPAMFVVRDEDTTVYIFGTFHALDGKSDWFKDRVRAAFEGSEERTRVEHTLLPAA